MLRRTAAIVAALALLAAPVQAAGMDAESIIQEIRDLRTDLEEIVARLQALEYSLVALEASGGETTDIFVAQPDAIARFSGSGTQNTRPFSVDGPWEIRWTASGSLIQIMVYDDSGDLVTLAANQSRPGRGGSYQPRGGRYYLGVNAIGDWEIVILDAD